MNKRPTEENREERFKAIKRYIDTDRIFSLERAVFEKEGFGELLGNSVQTLYCMQPDGEANYRGAGKEPLNWNGFFVQGVYNLWRKQRTSFK